MLPRGKKIGRWLREEAGQDLSEYCLLLALLVLIAAGVFLKMSGGIQSLWTVANTTLTTSSATTSVTSATGSQGH
jgi:Flp pilus assembly pilin Flp